MTSQESQEAGGARFDSVAAVFAVSLDQRIVSTTPAANTILGDGAFDRPCYEILRALDSRNSIQCRPECAQVTAARAGYAPRGAVIWDAGRLQPRSVTTLVQGDGSSPPVVIHVLRDANDPIASPTQASPHTLTRRQVETLRLLARGVAPRGIATALGVSPVTVRNHIQTAMERLNAHTRLEAVVIALQAGLV